MKKKTKLAAVATLAAFLAPVFLKPVDHSNDTFFRELSLNVPAKFIVSHKSPFWLMAVEDELILKIPNREVLGIKKQFAAQKNFHDASPNLPSHYGDFVSGREKFFPSLPARFQAGSFVAFDAEKGSIGRPNHYYCRFLFNEDTPNLTTLYLSSTSPID